MLHEELSQLFQDYGLPSPYITDIYVDHVRRVVVVTYMTEELHYPPEMEWLIGFDQHPSPLGMDTPIYDDLKLEQAWDNALYEEEWG